ncbi:MAG: PilZ domain-containing protein [Candidatus Competibacteraceae bacterium]
MRQFIRHPADIPIVYDLVDIGDHEKDYLKNVSEGGLCFRANTYIKVGCAIHISIPIREPAFEITGIIVWCCRTNGHYDVGVKFKDASTEFSIRMVEQICHINHYRNEVLEKEGRVLSGQEAAAEWIAKFSSDFPR